jgi:hypothetical protein
LQFGGFDIEATDSVDRTEPGADRPLGVVLVRSRIAEIDQRTAGLTDPDDAPAVPEHPVSQTGDLWLLGATVTCPKCRKTSPLERAIKR